LALGGIHAQHLRLHLVADFQHVLRPLHLVVGQLRNVDQAFQTRLQLTKTPKLVSLVTLPF